MLVVLFVLGGFSPFIDADFAARVLMVSDGVITGRFPDSLLLSLPPCDIYAGQSVDLEYLNANTNENKTFINIFTVPNCTNTTIRVGSTVLSRDLGYQLMNLTSDTEYRLRYTIGTANSNPIMAITRTVFDYNEIEDGLPARSGAMVVITVTLSVAMFLLLACLILSWVRSSG